MDSIYLQTIVEVVERGGVTKAAESLCVTQSAVSRRLKNLESLFGQELLDRSGPEPVPNAAGQVVCAKARRILELERELEGEIRGGNWSRPLRFCCTPAFGTSHLPGVMSRFMDEGNRCRGIEIHFEMPDRILSGMDRGRYDLSVLDFQGCCSLGKHTSISLPGDEIVFLSGADLGIREGESTLEDLLPHTLITRKEGCCSRRCLDANLSVVGHSEADFRNVVVIDDLHLIAQSLRDGMGLTFLPSDLFRREIDRGEFRVHRVSGFDHDRSRVVLIGSNREDDPQVRAFVESVRSVVDCARDAH